MQVSVQSWLSIISNPSFIKSHIHNAIIASRNIPKIASVVDHFLKLQDLSFTCPVHIDFIVMSRLFHETLLQPVLVGCCNGIICLYDDMYLSVYLWNPAIRQCMEIPSPMEHQFNGFFISFGYDSINDDYKVLEIKYMHDTSTNKLPVIQVYSANTNSWREFQSPIVQNWMDIPTDSIAVNGVLYFQYSEGLISFNLHTEVFGLVSFPRYINRTMSYVMNFEDSVAMLFQCVDEKLLYLWTLDNVSGQMTWIKMHSVKENLGSGLWFSYLGMGLYFGLQRINSCDYNVFYDYEKKVTQLCEPVKRGIGIAYKYTESLVSLQGFQQVE